MMNIASTAHHSRLQQFLVARLRDLKNRKSQVDIALEAGFTNSNFISMLKIGKSKLALDRVPAMAKALDTDPAYLFRLALEQFVEPAAYLEITPLFRSVITENEGELLDIIRAASDATDPAPTLRIKGALETVFRPESLR